MTLVEFNRELRSLGLPVAYNHFAEGSVPKLPYIVYYSEGDENFAADGIVYASNNDVVVELYTKTKNLATEKKMTDLFTKHGIFYETDETYIESEDMYQLRYEITL